MRTRHHRYHHHRDPEPSTMALSSRDMQHLRQTLGDAHSYIQSLRDPGDSSAKEAGPVVGALEIVAGALLNGYVSSRFDDPFHPKGTSVPLDAVGSIAVLLGTAYFGNKIPGSAHLARGAIGFLAGYGFKAGAGFGTQQRTAQNLPPVAVVAGALPAPQRVSAGCGPQGRPLTEAEMAARSRSYG